MGWAGLGKLSNIQVRVIYEKGHLKYSIEL
jgi:hypothetical protein